MVRWGKSPYPPMACCGRIKAIPSYTYGPLMRRKEIKMRRKEIKMRGRKKKKKRKEEEGESRAVKWRKEATKMGEIK